MISHRSPDIEAEVWFIPTEEGGKSKPAFSGYRPQHLIMDNYQTSGEHQYINKEQVNPGERAIAKIWFISPEVYPKSLWIGREIEIKEGSWLVGCAKVTKIFNPILESETQEIQKWDPENDPELTLRREMLRFGYTQFWFDAGLLTMGTFLKQINQQKFEGDTNYEHYRYAMFNTWLKENAGANDRAILDYIEAAVHDPDPVMAGGAIANLMDAPWLTDAQFEKVIESLQGFGKWTASRIEKAKQLRFNRKN
jgi:hypothetical protein